MKHLSFHFHIEKHSFTNTLFISSFFDYNAGSESFKQSPNVSFDNIDYNDPIALKNAQESLLREQFVKIEIVKTVRKALENCFRVAGPNANEDCREIAEKYMNMLPDGRAQGFLGYQRNDPSK